MAYQIAGHSAAKVGLSVAAVFLLLVLFPALFNIIFTSRFEVSFQAAAANSSCRQPIGDQARTADSCLARYLIVIGNTGSESQERVRIRLSPPPQIWSSSYGSRDIVATARQRPRPTVTEQPGEDILEFLISDLAPNKMVQITLSSRGQEEWQRMQTMQASIDATGTVIAGGPEVTTFVRLLRNLFGLF